MGEVSRAELINEIRAMRELLHAIAEAQTPLPEDPSKMPEYHKAASKRLNDVVNVVGPVPRLDSIANASVFRGRAEQLRGWLAEPIGYEPQREKGAGE